MSDASRAIAEYPVTSSKPGNGFAARRRKAGVWLLLPTAVTLLAVVAYPIVQSIILSFQRVEAGSSIFDGLWIGLKNYSRLFSDPVMLTGIANTLYFTVVEVVVVITMGVLFGLLLNHPRVRSPFFRLILLIPWAIAPVANATIWKWIYNANYGILNSVLHQLGLIDQNIVWLGDAALALNMLLLADIWKSIPFIALLLLAGMRNIPPVLYRAAQLDGASKFQAFRFVTLPQLKTTLLITVVLQSIWAMKVFDLIYVLTQGGPASGTVTLNYLSYRTAFNFGDIGYGATVANVLFLFLFLIALAYVQVLGRNRKPGIGI